MTEEQWSANVAVGLMRMALELLDKIECGMGAARLQHAIDTVVAQRQLKPGEELPPELACLVAGIPFSRPAETERSTPRAGSTGRQRPPRQY